MSQQSTMIITKRLPNGNLQVTVPITIQCVGNGKVIKGMVSPEEDPNRRAILVAFARARRWQQFLDDGSVKNNLELADRLGRNESYVARILRLATVSPAIVRAVIAGEFNPMLSLTKLCKSMPVTWEEQEKMYLGK